MLGDDMVDVPRSGFEPQVPLRTPVVGCRRLAAGQDVAGRGFGVKMQLDSARMELADHVCNALLDRRMIRAVAGDELLDNGPPHRRRPLRVGDAHAVIVLHGNPKAK